MMKIALHLQTFKADKKFINLFAVVIYLISFKIDSRVIVMFLLKIYINTKFFSVLKGKKEVNSYFWAMLDQNEIRKYTSWKCFISCAK